MTILTPRNRVRTLIRQLEAEIKKAMAPYKKKHAADGLTHTEKQRMMRINKAGRSLERLAKYLEGVPIEK